MPPFVKILFVSLLHANDITTPGLIQSKLFASFHCSGSALGEERTKKRILLLDKTCFKMVKNKSVGSVFKINE